MLGSFYKGGFDRGEKATHIVDPENREAYLKRLTDAGINVHELMDTGRLEVLPWTDTCDFNRPREHSWISRS